MKQSFGERLFQEETMNLTTVRNILIGLALFALLVVGGCVAWNNWVAPNLPPSAPATLTVNISGPAAIRAGQEAQYVAKVNGGTGPYDYDWFYTGGADSGSDKVKVKFAESGTAVVEVTAYDSTGISASKQLTVTVRAAIASTPTPNPRATPGAPRPPTTGGSEKTFQEQKCAYLTKWLTDKGILDVDGIKLRNWLAGGLKLPQERIRPHLYDCGSGKTVPDGLIILGPNEGWSGDVTIETWIPETADSYAPANGAKYVGGCVEKIGDNSYRVWDGKVTAQTITWWIMNDKSPSWNPLARAQWPCNFKP